MTAYYNEIDPLKAETLREAIKAGAIAPGDVDERSIADVESGDLVGYTQCHFFAGGGFWSLALRWAGWPDDWPAWTGSCPCPSFSAAGKGRGFDDPRHLWPHWDRLIDKSRPAVIFGEQADDAIGYGWLDLVQTDLEAKAYSIGSVVLGAHSVGAPHIRQRLYFVADTEVAQRRPIAEANGRTGRSEKARRPRGARSVGDATRGGFREHGSTPRDTGHAHVAGTIDWVGDALGAGLEGHNGDGDHRHESGRQRTLSAGSTTATSDAGELAHTHGGVAGNGELQRSGQHGLEPENGRAGELADTAGIRLPGRWLDHSGGEKSGGIETAERSGIQQHLTARGSNERPGPLNGFWRDVDWILCRDGKFRPVEPGTFPLAHGGTARVGRLRLYGDGIVVTAAQAFIESYCEARGL